MAEFNLRLVNAAGTAMHIIYDNMHSTLVWLDTGKPVIAKTSTHEWGTAVAVSATNPGTKHNVKVLKISLGLSCNFACSYCSQRFVPTATESTTRDVSKFIDGLPGWFDTSATDTSIEFWGGEPLVYWKTLLPLATKLREMMPHTRFSMVTNGSLLTPEINESLDRLGFSVAISHDGPGQPQRGPDPLENPTSLSAILDLYRRLRPANRISINSMLTRSNSSRAAISAHLVKIFGKDVQLGEGSFVDPYDAGGFAAMLHASEHHAYRQAAFTEMLDRSYGQFMVVPQKIMDFIGSIRDQRPATSLGQKCGMDRSDNMAVTLSGDVITCQNVTPVSKAPNQRHHKIGNVNDLDGVRLNTSRHWSTRDDCPSCPVLQLCKGACMFLDGQLFDAACETSYSDNITILAAAVYELTNMVVTHVVGPHKLERHAIWGE